MSSPGGKTEHILDEQTLTHSGVLSLQWMSVLSLLFSLDFHHALTSLPPPSAGFFFFLSVAFQQLFQWFHCYLGIVTTESNASSCFVRADTLLWCRNSFLVSPRKKSGSRQNSIETLRLSRSLYIFGFFFFYLIYSYFIFLQPLHWDNRMTSESTKVVYCQQGLTQDFRNTEVQILKNLLCSREH